MKKAFYLLIIIILLLTGCQGNQEGFIKKSEGIYYHKRNSRDITRTFRMDQQVYTLGMLHYDDRMYTFSQVSSSSMDKNDLNLDSICEEELGTVYGNNRVLWSTDKDELSAVTNEGTIYRLNGYDESFRIAVYFVISMPLSDTIYHLEIFDSLNDITLHKGSDLFGDRFNLKESVYIEGYFVKDKIHYEISSKHEFSIEDKIVDDFLTELYKGVFIDPASEEYPKLKARPSYVLSFQDAIGLVTDILVYEEGYAALNQTGVDEMIVKIDTKVCKDIIDIILSSQ